MAQRPNYSVWSDDDSDGKDDDVVAIRHPNGKSQVSKSDEENYVGSETYATSLQIRKGQPTKKIDNDIESNSPNKGNRKVISEERKRKKSKPKIKKMISDSNFDFDDEADDIEDMLQEYENGLFNDEKKKSDNKKMSDSSHKQVENKTTSVSDNKSIPTTVTTEKPTITSNEFAVQQQRMSKFAKFSNMHAALPVAESKPTLENDNQHKPPIATSSPQTHRGSIILLGPPKVQLQRDNSQSEIGSISSVESPVVKAGGPLHRRDRSDTAGSLNSVTAGGAKGEAFHFHGNDASGKFKMQEITSYNQSPDQRAQRKQYNDSKTSSNNPTANNSRSNSVADRSNEISLDYIHSPPVHSRKSFPVQIQEKPATRGSETTAIGSYPPTVESSPAVTTHKTNRKKTNSLYGAQTSSRSNSNSNSNNNSNDNTPDNSEPPKESMSRSPSWATGINRSNKVKPIEDHQQQHQKQQSSYRTISPPDSRSRTANTASIPRDRLHSRGNDENSSVFSHNRSIQKKTSRGELSTAGGSTTAGPHQPRRPARVKHTLVMHREILMMEGIIREYPPAIKLPQIATRVKFIRGRTPGIIYGSPDGSLVIHNLRTGSHQRNLSGHTDKILSMAVSLPLNALPPATSSEHRNSIDAQTPQQKTYLVTGSQDEYLRVWHLESNTCIQTIHTTAGIHQDPQYQQKKGGAVYAVAIAARVNGDIIVVSGSIDGSMVCWDAVKGQRLHTFKGHSDKIMTLSILDPLSSLPVVFSAGVDRLIYAWELLTGTFVRAYEGHEDEITTVVAERFGGLSTLTPLGFNRQSQTLQQQVGKNVVVMSGSKDLTVRIWDFKTGYLLFALLGHTKTVTEVNLLRFPRGRCYEKTEIPAGTPIVVSSAEDGTIRLWNLTAGKLLRTMKWHRHGIKAVDTASMQKSTDEELVLFATVGGDKTLQLHNLENCFHGRDIGGCRIS